MDLGCLDLCCISVSEKENMDPGINSSEKDRSPVESTRSGKNKLLKENGQSTNILSRSIKKPPHRKISPLNWFPRKKVDSYISRKIKLLQEVDGMNSTLDEALCDANPHYSKVLREKIAARDAAQNAMEARKAALVEASWCRILQAARIQSKEAEEVSLRAEKAAAEAFEAASALGVIMYDKPNCPRKPSKLVTSSINCGGVATHTVTASFETAFDVDREVAAAVKTAFIKLAKCSSFSKDEVKDLLHKISQNPDTAENNQESPEYDSESGSDFETIPEKSDAEDIDLDSLKAIVRSKYKRRQSIEKLTREKLVDMMFERLKCLQEEELSSLATIVATCGLNAALAEAETHISADHSASTVDTSRRMSTSAFARNYTRKEHDVPSLEKFLVKNVSKLEKEVKEAKSSRSNSARVGNHENANEMSHGNATSDETKKLGEIEPSTLGLKSKDGKKNDEAEGKSESNKLDIHANVCRTELDLGSVLIRHSSRLEREIEEIKRNREKTKGPRRAKDSFSVQTATHTDIPSLDMFLVKHVSKLEREVQEAKLKRENSRGMKKQSELVGKENMKSDENGSKVTEDSLESILIKPVHRLDREKQAWSSKSSYAYQKKQDESKIENCESLDKVLVKHVCNLEKEKTRIKTQDEYRPKAKTTQLQTDEHGSLDQILVKHKSRLEREKTVAAPQPGGEEVKVSVSRREAREKELQEAWGGLSLGNSIRPHLSRLERDKIAWIKAEEEERMKAMKSNC